jgi:metal-responsive CopG/Arc/MetJ family transcriptional regulator
MKTAISIPNSLFEAAEAFAREHGYSRSELYARAVQMYLATFQDQQITEALNSIYGEDANEIELAVRTAQGRAIGREEW